ncbi:MAG: hypothetical protein P0Y52_00655 [Candidatus Brevundimonas phytovorans]|nr:hypothetical protein [Brevundimonas sp.]WEK58080.1 MAG: hypothetical protein P0Y52_00655 [Brevundimonas sp.]
MSQHNIIGSEAFSQRPFVIIRGVKTGGIRRRRSGSAAAYIVVALLALSAGAAVAAFALGPLMVEAAPADVVIPATATNPVPASPLAPATPSA